MQSYITLCHKMPFYLTRRMKTKICDKGHINNVRWIETSGLQKYMPINTLTVNTSTFAVH